MEHILQRAWNELKETALQDNELTEEEMNVIQSVMEGLERYFILLTKINEEGSFDEGDKHFLFLTRERIWENAYATALEDNHLSNEEHMLLMKVGELMLELEDMEY
ncbi:MAG: hypothetical protein D6732_08855 [Methanobacteriota archaeon]|nr:MAG: hypothetical protein D6732_08855 [Euryarchaeota archaeon]